MSEEQVGMSVEEEGEVPAEDKQPKPDISGELQELGRQLSAATRAVLESPEAQEVGAQMQHGLESLEKTVGQLVSQARETKVGKRVESTVSEAAGTVKERGVIETLTESVSTALRTVNQALAQAVEKAEARTKERKEQRTSPQQIEVVQAEEEAPTEPEASAE